MELQASPVESLYVFKGGLRIQFLGRGCQFKNDQINDFLRNSSYTGLWKNEGGGIAGANFNVDGTQLFIKIEVSKNSFFKKVSLFD
ncbi:hypothetical protein GCM10027347_54180 [Larkinella harenae]